MQSSPDSKDATSDAPRSLELIRQLLRFDTTSRRSNLALIDWVREYLGSHGISSRLTHDDDKAKANLFATIGDPRRPGIVLSGHTDVVPVDGQAWTVDPWSGVVKDARLIGRGAADMKSFLGVVLAAVPEMLGKPLAMPIHLAFSYDEEVGCIGVGRMIRDMQDSGVAPGLCIVGEPTSMKVVTGHKGKLAARAHVCGREAHSALAPYAVNALEYAAEIIVELRRMQREVAENGPFNREYDPPYSTLHAGVLHAGTALNIVPRECTLEFEFRTVPDDDDDAFERQLGERVDDVQHHRTTAEGMQHLRRLGTHPCAFPGGEDDCAQRSVLLHAGSLLTCCSRARGRGFEPRLRTPKDLVLPLHHPRHVIDDSCHSRAFSRLLVGSTVAMGSLIKKRRKRMRKKKHKKLLKKTRWQRRQQGK